MYIYVEDVQILVYIYRRYIGYIEYRYGVASVSRIDSIIGLLSKRAL